MLAEKRTRAQPPTPMMLMSIPPFVPPSGRNSPNPSCAKDSSHPAAPSQQYNSSHPHHPQQQLQQQHPHLHQPHQPQQLQQPQQQQQHYQQEEQQQKQQVQQRYHLQIQNHTQTSNLVTPISKPPQVAQPTIHNYPPQQPQQAHVHQQHQKVQSQHPRRGSADRGSIKDPFKSKSLSTPKPINEYVGPYLLGKTLGKGSSGCVKLARHRKTNEQVAVKIISKASLVNRAAVHRGIEREIAIMKLINHPHVIRLYDVYETEKELFLVMEYVSGGELFEYLVNKGRLDETEALRFFQQIIVGLAFCHKRKICHRDLKPENLLLDDRMNVKIADFGMASLQKSGRLLETSCGSPHYASPEVVTGMKYDGSSSDIWSCGIILYALLTGHLPFDDENIRQLLSKVKAGKFYMPQDISAGARDLISRMLTVNPKRRITMQGVMMHPWFRMVNLELNTLGEPAQDPESGRPMLAEELDAEIIRHMRWLFAPGPSHSDPEAKEVFDEEALLLEIQEKMTNKEENMEKLFYHLLCQHKTELLENYIGDESDIMPDAPRRRADSFPNSAACSIRSATPDFSRMPLSPRDSPLTSPGSPLSPVAKGMDPTPLTLNPDAATTTSTSTHPGRMNEVRRGQSPTKMNPAINSSSNSSSHQSSKETTTATSASKTFSSSTSSSSAPSSRRGTPDYENRSRASFEKDQQGATVKSVRKDDSGRGDDVSKAAFSPKLTPVNGSIHESLLHVNVVNNNTTTTSAMTANPLMTPLSPPAARLPPLHPTEHVCSTAEEERKRGHLASTSEDAASTDLSIESQVLSTQISEISYSSAAARSASISAQSEPIVLNGGCVGSSAKTSSTEKSKSAASSIRDHRPILHPLDVKASAGTTAMNVSVPQHSRKYSEGTSSVLSTTPLSPMTGPKRPWFARLFDFKPQPLTFKSHVSAAEAQERVETILKNLFQSSIQIDPYKKPACGVKCRFNGGVIDDQPVKPVKFKVDISEKAGFLQSTAVASPIGTTAHQSNSSRAVSSSAVAAMLATAELHSNDATNNPPQINGSNSTSTNNTACASGSGSGSLFNHVSSGSSSSSSSNGTTNAGIPGPIPASFAGPPIPSPAPALAPSPAHVIPFMIKKKPSAILTARRASDGGSILSSAAAAVTSHFASRLQFHHSNSPGKHRHSVHGVVPNAKQTLPLSAVQAKRIVKVTLHQQQGANSTLKMIYERLCAAWDQPLYNGELRTEEEGEHVKVASPMTIVFPQAAAIAVAAAAR